MAPHATGSPPALVSPPVTTWLQAIGSLQPIGPPEARAVAAAWRRKNLLAAPWCVPAAVACGSAVPWDVVACRGPIPAPAG